MSVVPRHVHFPKQCFLIFLFLPSIFKYNDFCIWPLNPDTLLNLLRALNEIIDKPQAYHRGSLPNSSPGAEERRWDQDSAPEGS